MELVWIEDFIALCETRHFTRAAGLRHTTQSAFSRRIMRLEEWLGTPLFNREGTPIALTSAGEAFLAKAKGLYDDILDAQRATLRAASYFETSLRIITTNTIAISFLPNWLTKRGFKNYSLVVASNTGCLEAIRQKRAHLAIISRFEDDPQLDGVSEEIIGMDLLSLVANSEIQPQVKIENRFLKGPLMVYTPGTAYGAKISHKLQQHNIMFSEPPVCESASAEALLAQVKAGLGAAWIPRLLIQNDVQDCNTSLNLDIPYRLVLVKNME